jgi:hypothetical protein
MKSRSGGTCVKRGRLDGAGLRLAGWLLLGLVVLWGPGSCAEALELMEEGGEGDFNLVGTLKVENPADLEARILINFNEETRDHYALRVNSQQVRLVATVGGKSEQIGLPLPVTLAADSYYEFVLQRRSWRLTLLWAGKVAIRAYDRRLHDGQVAYEARGGSWEELLMQPVGDLVVEDDFVREEGAESVWEPMSGEWEAKTLRDDEQAAQEEPEKSANAFSYLGSGTPRGITVTGNWFWDDYAMETALKPLGEGAVGIVWHYQDEENYLAARWTPRVSAAGEANRLQLVAMEGGESRVVAERAGGYRPGQWYKMRVEVCEGQVKCLIDDETWLQTRLDLFGQGLVGLYVEGKSGAYFDDVVCLPWDEFREDFTTVIPGKWTKTPGWEQQNGVMTARGNGAPLSVTGAPEWQRYWYAAEVTALGEGGVGAVFAWQGSDNYCLVRWAAAGSKAVYQGKVQLVAVREGEKEILDEAPLPDGERQRQVKVSVNQGVVTASLNDQVQLYGVAPAATGGLVGLYAEGPGVFDNLQLASLSAHRSSHVTKEFTVVDRHPEMGEWASTRAAWTAAEGESEVWWTKGDYFADTRISVVVPKIGEQAGELRMTLGATEGQKSGLTLTVTGAKGSQMLKLAVTVRDNEVATAETDELEAAEVAFSREGPLALVRVNDKIVLYVRLRS